MRRGDDRWPLWLAVPSALAPSLGLWAVLLVPAVLWWRVAVPPVLGALLGVLVGVSAR